MFNDKTHRIVMAKVGRVHNGGAYYIEAVLVEMGTRELSLVGLNIPPEVLGEQLINMGLLVEASNNIEQIARLLMTSVEDEQ